MSRRVCLIEDDAVMGESLCLRLELEGIEHDWFRSGLAGREALGDRPYGTVICDIRLPDINGDEIFGAVSKAQQAHPPFIFITGYADIETAIKLLKEGASDYLTKPFDLDALIERVHALLPPAGTEPSVRLGVSAAMRAIEAMLPRLAGSGANVMIQGESGVGKEWVAQALHRARDPRAPFVTVNCGAFAESLLEAELFGHEKGAFTGAVRMRRGVFERADGGTLFLDEVGDMPLPMQIKLLRVIQERQLTRVGGEETIAVDFHLLCATHRDLKQMVEAGEFREDLYYRLNVLPLRVLPLRERKDDILWLARRFLAEFAARTGRGAIVLHPAAERALLNYPWPGNVRELRHTLERACLLSDHPSLAAEDLFEDPPAATASLTEPEALAEYMRECERAFILHALQAHDWHIQACASALEISRKNLWEKMRKLGIERSPEVEGN